MENALKDMIRQSGPVDVATFMGMAVAHYYATRDPFGARGDFTTAPEISQMFGEMIGVCLADAWMQMGSPASFDLIEAGPGRGTLMADIIRATRHVPGFHAAMRIVLIETSPELRKVQATTLRKPPLPSGEGRGEGRLVWCDHIGAVDGDGPVLFVGNEFLDALPIHQYIRVEGTWHERVVRLDEAGDLAFGIVPAPSFAPPAEGDFFEVSPAREAFVDDLSHMIAARGGVGLLIDYGHDATAPGDTLQAVKDHRYADVLRDVGDADLTSHVDFGALAAVARACVHVSGPVGQGDFLRRLGIDLRAARLDQAQEAQRLCVQMGTLFRVMGLCHDGAVKLVGF